MSRQASIAYRLMWLCWMLLWTGSAVASVDILVNLGDSPDPMPAGGQLTYTLVVANNGPDDATGVQITNTLPAGVSLVSVTPSQGSCTGTTVITCNLGNINNNNNSSISIVVTVPTVATTLTNSVTSTRNEVDNNAGNDNAIELTTVVLSSDLRMTKTDSVDPVSQGQNYDYRLVVRNLGPNAHPSTENITVTDNIPLGMRLRSIPTGTGWSCTSSAGTTFPQNGPLTVTCTRSGSNALALNTDLPTITVPVLALASGNVINQATVVSSMPDNNTGNNTGLQPTAVSQAADLSVAKTIPNASPLGAGQTYTYTITPRLVVGETLGAIITVTDPLPNDIQVTTAPTTINSAGTWSCNYSPAQSLPFVVSPANPVNLVCSSSSSYSNSDLASLKLADIQFSFVPQIGGTLTNTANISIAGLVDPVSGNNNTSVVRTVNAGADLRVTKTSTGSSTKAINTNFEYRLDYRNAGPALIPSGNTVSVVDQLPAGVRVNNISAPAGWSCPATPINGPALITCTRDGLGVSGSDARITLFATTTANGTQLNRVSISSPVFDQDTSNNESSNVIQVFTAGSGGGTFSDLSITKQDTAAGVSYGPDPVGLGGNVRYRLRMNNNGPSNMPNARVVTVTDTLPFNASFVSVTPLTAAQGWSCSFNAGLNQIVCTRTINTSSSATQWNVGSINDIDVVLRADSGNSMTNTAQISTTNDPIGGNNIASEATTILLDADLRVTKTVSAPQVLFGQNYTYTFVVENLSGNPIPAGATGAIRLIDDMRPNPDANHVSNTGAANGWSCVTSGTGGADPLICDYQGGLAVGASTSFSVTVSPRTVGNARPNTAEVTFLPSAVLADPDLNNNNSTVLIDVLPSADMQISKTASLPSVAVGQNLTYLLTARNNGPNTATNVTLIDQLPTHVTVQSVSATGSGVCQMNTPAVGQVRCVWPSMNSNTTQSATIVVRATLPAEGTVITNTATISADQIDTNSANNSSNVSTNVTQAVIDLLLNKIDQQDPVPQLGSAVYEVRVTNLGPSVATDVVLSEQLPHTFLNFVSATPAQGVCAAPDVNHLMLCQLGSIEAGQTVLILIEMSADVIGTDNNSASVSANETDSNLSNNSANENTTVQLGADVSVVKSVVSPDIFVGVPFVYQLNVANAGPANSNVTLTDDLPAGLVFQSVTTSRGSCSFVAPTLTCGLGLMSANQTALIELTVVALDAGSMTNTVLVVGTAPEINPNNNHSSAEVTSRIRVAGRVFVDNSGNSGVAALAYNGVQDTDEVSLAQVQISLTDCASNTLAVTQTDAAGDYEFLREVNLPAQTCVNQTNLSGYQSVSGAGASYDRLNDRHQINTVNGQSYIGLNFGDARLVLTLTANGQKTTVAGGTVSYAHRLQALSVVDLTGLLIQPTEQPVAQGWSVLVYDDGAVGDGLLHSCNGQIEANEQTVTTLSGVLLPTDERCLVVRVNAPAQVAQGMQHVVSLQATYRATLQDGTLITGQSNPNTDTTLVGSGGLQMIKQVREVETCPSTSMDTLPFSDRNQVSSGGLLEYQIVYRNSGLSNLTRIRVRDSVPSSTRFKAMSCHAQPHPTVTCQTDAVPPINATEGQLSWLIEGVIAPNQSGEVRFCVEVPSLDEQPIQ